MTEKGREIWLVFVIIVGGGLLAWQEVITGDQWISLAEWLGGGTALVRSIYKGFKVPIIPKVKVIKDEEDNTGTSENAS